MSSMANAHLPRVSMAVNGECSGRREGGPWVAIISCDDETRMLTGTLAVATTDRLELAAAVEGLVALEVPSRVGMHTESLYVFDGVSRRMETWRERGWKNADGRRIGNHDLWMRLEEQCRRHRISWTWCSAHHGPLHDASTRLVAESHQTTEETERSCA